MTAAERDTGFDAERCDDPLTAQRTSDARRKPGSRGERHESANPSVLRSALVYTTACAALWRMRTGGETNDLDQSTIATSLVSSGNALDERTRVKSSTGVTY
jgi:hypothetical protein